MVGRCPICQEILVFDEIAALACGHTFHLVCVTQWLTNSPSCPTCRKKIRKSDIINQLFFDTGEDSLLDSPSKTVPKERVRKYLDQIREQETKIQNVNAKLIDKEKEAASLKDKADVLRRKKHELEDALKVTRSQLGVLDQYKTENGRLTKEVNQLQKHIQNLEIATSFVKATGAEAEKCMKNMDVGALQTSLTILKKELEKANTEKSDQGGRIKKLERENASLKQAIAEAKSRNSPKASSVENAPKVKRHKQKRCSSDDSSDSCEVETLRKYVSSDDDTDEDAKQICKALKIPAVRTTSLAEQAAKKRRFGATASGYNDEDNDVDFVTSFQPRKELFRKEKGVSSRAAVKVQGVSRKATPKTTAKKSPKNGDDSIVCLD